MARCVRDRRGLNLGEGKEVCDETLDEDRKSTRLNSSHQIISYAVFCLKKKKQRRPSPTTQPFRSSAWERARSLGGHPGRSPHRPHRAPGQKCQHSTPPYTT